MKDGAVSSARWGVYYGGGLCGHWSMYTNQHPRSSRNDLGEVKGWVPPAYRWRCILHRGQGVDNVSTAVFLASGWIPSAIDVGMCVCVRCAR